jgi:DNA-directed RNA polymerase specialized sigma24 family protein
MAYNAEQAARELAACPTDLPGTAQARTPVANQAAKALARDIRTYDIRQCWGRIRLMSRDELEALAISLAARCIPPPEHGEDHALDWCRSIGGVAALHPDYHKAVVHLPADAPERERQIMRLHAGGLRRAEIARRVGVSYSRVQRTITRYQTQGAAA